MSSFHLRFVGAGEQAGTANECGVCGEVTNGRVLRCQQAGFTLDSNRCDLHRNRDHPATPGELLHIDTKRLGRIHVLGDRITGDRAKNRNRGIGWEAVHLAIYNSVLSP